jgi:hypothetical protein
VSGTPLNGRTSRSFFTSIKIDGFEVSCAAPNPFRAGFAFGSDNGKMKFTDEAGTLLLDLNGSPSGESLNGIAGFGRSIAVSTRKEVALRTWRVEKPDLHTVSVVPHGAHGINATPGGYYVAPLGQAGIMMMKAESGPGDPVGVMTAENEDMYFYRVLARRGRGRKDLLVCATRRGGIGIAEVRWEDNTYNMRTATFSGLDSVDVCFVGGEPDSPAVAAVGLDGSIVLARDLLHDKNPVTMKFDTVQGRAYRLLLARGHLFLLTSCALYGLMNLGTRLMHGLPEGKFTTPIFMMPMEAVDASVIDDRWLLVVMVDEVRKFDLDLIQIHTLADIRDGEIREATVEPIERLWKYADIRPESRELEVVS